MLHVRLQAERQHTGGAAENHYRRAESQFFRCLSAAPSPAAPSLKSVTYVFNPPLVARFEAKKAAFDAAYGRGKHHTVLLFHGTPKKSAIDGIVANGFDMARVGSTTDAGFHGAGAYLSELTDMSVEYSGGNNQLLLCRVLLGRPYRLRLDEVAGMAFMGKPAKRGYDSHVTDASFSEVVIFDAAQILPCYVLQLQRAGRRAGAHAGMLPLTGVLDGGLAAGGAAADLLGGAAGGFPGWGTLGAPRFAALPGKRSSEDDGGADMFAPVSAAPDAHKFAAAAEKRRRAAPEGLAVADEVAELARGLAASAAAADAAAAEEAELVRAIEESLQDAALRRTAT